MANKNIVESEIMTQLTNLDIDIKDARLFVEINTNNLYPIDTSIDSDGKLIIDAVQESKNKNLYLGTKRQFLYKQYIVSSTSNKLDLDSTFKSGWDPTRYLIFRNGYKLHPSIFKVKCPTLTKIFATKTIYSLVKFNRNDRIDVFYIESEDYFKNIECGASNVLRVYKYTASGNQFIINIPYPYESYTKEPNAFLVFNTGTKTYLKLDKDFTLHTNTTGGYINMKNSLSSGKSLLFLFPYCNATGIDTVQEISNMIINKCKGSSKSGNNITFSPSFTEYTLDKTNTLLFCDGELVPSSQYTITSNSVFNINNAKSYSSYYYLAISMKDFNNYENINRLFEIDQIPAIS